MLKTNFLIIAVLVLSLTGTAIALKEGPYYSAAPTLPAVSAGRVQSQPLSLDFPRLGMLWPNPGEQSIAELARYNWLVMVDSFRQFVQPLRELNPDIILLNSIGSSEVRFNPETTAEPWENAEALRIPPQWFLTQMGSTLTIAVNATETQFSVAAVTSATGSEVFDLFVPQEAVLIEGETVWVEAVDKVTKTLTVRRGYVRPASSHDAGTRLAAHITFWPRSWLLNLSMMCPKAVIDVAVGTEMLANYKARKAVALAGTAGWNGIMLDRVEPYQSWLIGTSTARTIDPDQSNRLSTDYSEFDRSWGEGVRLYEEAIRNALGPEKIIFVNNGMANYDLLNGSNFEGTPGDDISMQDWQRVVFGKSWDNTGSYFDWMAGGRQPNLTMIETFEENSAPDPTGDGAYDNPCKNPGFVPDYQRMRFGLTTALLNDGFFSYVMNGSGHGSSCLLWFDEYDNAGAGRGYLGQPKGPAYLALAGLDGPNLVGDSSFEVTMGGWSLWSDDGYQASVSLDANTAGQGGASARIDVTQSQGTDWKVPFSHGAIGIESGKPYTLSFWAKADQSDRPLTTWIQQGQPPWHGYIYFTDQLLKTYWKQFEISGVADGSDPMAGLHFGLGKQTGSVWLDDIRLQAGARQVWRRDYTGGTALVNATPETKTVRLGGDYRKIAGRQAPDINDGSRVDVVTLPPFDGLILLRQQNPLAGTAVIDLKPDALNAPWTLTRYSSYRQNGAGYRTITDLTPGDYTLTWGDISGWSKPDPPASTQNLVAGGTVTFTGTYSKIMDPLIQVTPSMLNFGYVPPGSYKDLTLQVKNIGIGILTGAASACPPFSIVSGENYSLGAGESQQVIVRYTAPLEEGAQTCPFVFTGGGGIEVQVKGTNKKLGLPWLMLLLGD